MNGRSHEAIRERAYVIWEREGRPQGRELEHWLQAESELAKVDETPLQSKAAKSSRPRNGSPATARSRSSRSRAKVR